MSRKPSDEKFIKWTESDRNTFKIREALAVHPALANITDPVSLFRFYIFSHYFYHSTLNLKHDKLATVKIFIIVIVNDLSNHNVNATVVFMIS